LRFCDNCGTYLRETDEGLWCPKCKKMIQADQRIETRKAKKKNAAAIYVVDKSKEAHSKVARRCPKCGNAEAFHWFSTVSGEHAGIRRERTVEHFKCVRCSHSWTESS